jgi:hypothetical protein
MLAQHNVSVNLDHGILTDKGIASKNGIEWSLNSAGGRVANVYKMGSSLNSTRCVSA